jgi:hypothetical protein
LKKRRSKDELGNQERRGETEREREREREKREINLQKIYIERNNIKFGTC